MIKDELIRWGLLLLGATLGLIAGVANAILINQIRGPFVKDSFALQGMIMSSCAIFILVIYITGYFGFRLNGRIRDAETVLKMGQWQAKIMNAFVLIIAIAGWFFP